MNCFDSFKKANSSNMCFATGFPKVRRSSGFRGLTDKKLAPKFYPRLLVNSQLQTDSALWTVHVLTNPETITYDSNGCTISQSTDNSHCGSAIYRDVPIDWKEDSISIRFKVKYNNGSSYQGGGIYIFPSNIVYSVGSYYGQESISDPNQVQYSLMGYGSSLAKSGGGSPFAGYSFSVSPGVWYQHELLFSLLSNNLKWIVDGVVRYDSSTVPAEAGKQDLRQIAWGTNKQIYTIRIEAAFGGYNLGQGFTLNNLVVESKVGG